MRDDVIRIPRRIVRCDRHRAKSFNAVAVRRLNVFRNLIATRASARVITAEEDYLEINGLQVRLIRENALA